MGATHSRPEQDLAIADRDAQIIDLKRQGLTFEEIANQLGISRPTAHRGFHRALRRVGADQVQAYRDEQLQHLALAREVVLDVLASYTRNVAIAGEGDVVDLGEDHAPIMSAVDRLVKLDDHEAKLLGMYAATKLQTDVQVSYTVGGGVDPELLK
jgi:DNA-binding CsgD family transcriptional regulator